MFRLPSNMIAAALVILLVWPVLLVAVIAALPILMITWPLFIMRGSRY